MLVGTCFDLAVVNRRNVELGSGGVRLRTQVGGPPFDYELVERWTAYLLSLDQGVSFRGLLDGQQLAVIM